ncbi:MAG: hypothetical protein SVM86_00440 [Candidatus Cloacimonadota bacterium]|nr:hypothetical protein [Candidatus Cloacimonadota bacterium]
MSEKKVFINKLPQKYKMSPFVRWFTFIFGIFAMVYAIWIIFNKINAEASLFYKIIPFVILFLALNSVIKNLISLNSVKFTKDKLIFGFLGKKAIKINWQDIKKLQAHSNKNRYATLTYEENGEEKKVHFTIAFPHILEILNGIGEMAPDIKLDDFMKKVIMK